MDYECCYIHVCKVESFLFILWWDIVRVKEVGGDKHIYYTYASVNKYTSLSVGTFLFPRHVPHQNCEIGNSNITHHLFGPHACM